MAGSVQNPNKGPLKITPLQNQGSLQNPKQGCLKCTRKKYPLKPLQNHKHGSDAHCTATPKYPSTKSQTFGSCPYALKKKLYYKVPLCSPQGLAFCRGNSWGYVFLPFDLKMCFAPQQHALFRHLNFQTGVFCAF